MGENVFHDTGKVSTGRVVVIPVETNAVLTQQKLDSECLSAQEAKNSLLYESVTSNPNSPLLYYHIVLSLLTSLLYLLCTLNVAK